MFRGGDSANPLEYQGERELSNMIDFIDKTRYHPVALMTDTQNSDIHIIEDIDDSISSEL
jgi:hypothetical protein